MKSFISEDNKSSQYVTNDLPNSYDRAAFNDKTNLLMEHFIDMAVQGYGCFLHKRSASQPMGGIEQRVPVA